MKIPISYRIAVLVAAMLFAFSTRSMAGIVNAYLQIEDSTGKSTTVKIRPDGSFTTMPMKPGTYKWSFWATAPGAASTGTVPKANESLPFRTILITPALQESAQGAGQSSSTGTSATATASVSAGGTSASVTGKRIHQPVRITKVIDKTNPMDKTDLGTFIIDVNGDALTGTIVAKTMGGRALKPTDWLVQQ